MTGRFIDDFVYFFRKQRSFEAFKYLETDYGKVRTFDSGGHKPVIINAPDAPNTIEHQSDLLQKLSKNYRVICFEYPGAGFSYPNPKFDYSFDHGAKVIFQIMEILKIDNAALIFSCSNGYYAMNAAMISGHKFNHIFMSQTPSIDSIVEWTKISVPQFLKIPIIGQITNKLLDKKIANKWYDVALPRDSKCKIEFKSKAQHSINHGACFCLSSLVQGLDRDKNRKLFVHDTELTLIWGGRDYSHRNTSKDSIKMHANNCEIFEFETCGHFPDLEDSKRFVKLVNERLH